MKQFSRMPTAIMVLIFTFVLFSCSNTGLDHLPLIGARHRDYHLMIRNQSGMELDTVAAVMGKYQDGAGIMIDGAQKTHLFFNAPISKEVVVSFIKGSFDPKLNQKTYVKKALIKLPESDFETMIFTINREFEIDVTFK